LNLKVDRRLSAAAGLAGVFILCIVMLNISMSLKKELTDLRARQKELLLLRDEFLTLRASVDAIESKKSILKAEGIVQAVDEVFRSLGLNRKVRSVKPTGTKEKKYAQEEEAEIQVEKVTMNELTNVLYRMENSPMVLSIKKTSLKTAFENPSFLNITMTVSLIKPK